MSGLVWNDTDEWVSGSIFLFLCSLYCAASFFLDLALWKNIILQAKCLLISTQTTMMKLYFTLFDYFPCRNLFLDFDLAQYCVVSSIVQAKWHLICPLQLIPCRKCLKRCPHILDVFVIFYPVPCRSQQYSTMPFHHLHVSRIQNGGKSTETSYRQHCIHRIFTIIRTARFLPKASHGQGNKRENVQ